MKSSSESNPAKFGFFIAGFALSSLMMIMIDICHADITGYSAFHLTSFQTVGCFMIASISGICCTFWKDKFLEALFGIFQC